MKIFLKVDISRVRVPKTCLLERLVVAWLVKHSVQRARADKPHPPVVLGLLMHLEVVEVSQVIPHELLLFVVQQRPRLTEDIQKPYLLIVPRRLLLRLLWFKKLFQFLDAVLLGLQQWTGRPW